MTDTAPDPSGNPDGPAEPVVQARWRPSMVWLLPLVAAFVGAVLAVKAYTSRGPAITITFLSAEGLEAGQTKVRYKDVEVGKVTAVNLTKDLSRVLVTAEIRKEAAPLLSANTRFWIVRARIGSGGISGLGTLLSGAYIAMDPGQPVEDRTFEYAYTGLETPGLMTTHQPGLLVTLKAARAGSINIGSPVHYRQIRVGEVAGYDLDKGGESVSIKAFINAPYDALVRTETKFWDAGGVDVSLDANGLRVRSESLADILLGGIAFENPVSLEASEKVGRGHVFTLYPNHDAISEKVIQNRHHYVLHFNESVRGLTPGAPVEFQGIKVGEVEDFRLEFHADTLEGKIPVLIALEPERFTVVGAKAKALDAKATDAVLQQLVRRGLRAQLKPASLLTGSMFVDLAFAPQPGPRVLARYGKYPEIPTMPSTMTAMVDNIARLAERLQKLPLEQIVSEVRAALPALKEALEKTSALMAKLDTETAPQAKATLEQAQATLATLDQTLRADSPTQQDLRRALEEFAKASKALRELAETLERQPESLVFGKGKER
jgi:paraquat-inducible protein B